MPFFGIPIRNGLPIGLGTVAGLSGPTAAPSPPPPPATDPFFEYVPLLLNTTSTNGAQNNTFLDSSTNNFTVTRNGDTTQGSFNPYMPSGYWSGFFDGTGDYLSATSNAAFSMGTGTYTVELWVYLTATQATGVFFQVAGGLQFSTNNSNNISIAEQGVAFDLSSTTTVPLNQWVHLAASRDSGNTTRIFLNGSEIASGTVTKNYAQGAAYINYNVAATTVHHTGYYSNLRIVKGTAVYTANFTPSTTPLTAITNTSLLCLQDNRFKDNSTNAFAITVNGDTRISKFAPFNPPASYSTASYGGSGYFDGTGDYLSIARNNAFLPGANTDFTVEAWIYLTAVPTAPILGAQVIGLGEYGLDSDWAFGITPGSQVSFYINATVTSYTNTTATVPLNTWTHIAASRSGTGSNNLKVFINGVGQSFTTNSTLVGTGLRNLTIGADQNGDETNFTGYMSSLRFVNRTGVYTADFTPPTTPLTAITNTSLLLNFTNAGIYDAATINDGQTVGNAQVSTTQAKWGTTSMAFDGTGDYVTVIDKPELRIGTGDFTIEGWVYLTATGVAYGLVSKGAASTGWSVNVTSGNKLQFSYTATQLTGATSLASGTWYYFAVVRSGTATGNLKVYLNGSVDATSAGAVTDAFTQTNSLYVGADRVAGAVLNGYLQDVRVTNGYARTITTPTAAFPTL